MEHVGIGAVHIVELLLQVKYELNVSTGRARVRRLSASIVIERVRRPKLKDEHRVIDAILRPKRLNDYVGRDNDTREIE